MPLEPDTLWKIELGVVRSFTWDEEGRTVTLGFWGKGDVVGHLLSRMKPYQVECLTTVQISELSPENSYLQHALLVHAWRSEELLTIVHQPSIADRLVQLLLWLSNQFGQPVASGTLLELRLTHQDLADTIGSTRVTVTRLLNEMEREGKIERSRRTILIRCSLLRNKPLKA
ncbi:MAG: Crp/Fnr family transcriptional regulator [Microcoleus sp. SIO2G3]|nr:Crp/Fnr family transcriptional regulator [Microcoleus sp. SIO2G3]